MGVEERSVMLWFVIFGVVALVWLYFWLTGHWFAAVIAALVGAWSATCGRGPFDLRDYFILLALPWVPIIVCSLFRQPPPSDALPYH